MMHTDNDAVLDPIEALLKASGRRHTVDEEIANRVERHSFEYWQRSVEARRRKERRQRRRMIGVGIALAASVVLAAVLIPKQIAPVPYVGDVVVTVGVVERGGRGEPMTRAVAGTQIPSGGFVETGNEAGVSLLLASGHSLRVGELSRVRIELGSVILDRGHVYVDSGSSGNSRPITVQSVHAIVQEIGTQYQIRLLDHGLEVGVREGRVGVQLDSAVVTAAAGELVSLDEGNVSRSDVPAYGEYWAWATQLAPVVPIDGKTVDEVLTWLARESGWQISYATESLRTDARLIRVNGSIEDLALEDALKSILASVGWSYRLADGVVTVGADSHDPEQ